MNSTRIALRRARRFFACSALTLLLAFSSATVFAQAATAKPTAPAPSAQENAARAARIIQGSTYHPNQLPGIDCTVAVDWRSLFKPDAAAPPPVRLRAFEGLNIHVHSLRDKPADLAFRWTDGTIVDGNQMEDGLKGIVGGLFESMYWPYIVYPPVTAAAEIKSIERGADGMIKVRSIRDGEAITTTLDADGAPSQVISESREKTATIDFHYSPSPNPHPGDLRRVASLEAHELYGDADTRMALEFDYQQVDTFFIPKHVKVTIVGINTVAFELTGCTVPALAQ